jgi:hypothetical protein
MSRLEKYKQLRSLRQRYFISVLLFLFLLVTGICIADSSINGLMSGGSGLNLFSVKKYENSLELVFMNKKLYLNTQYIQHDLQNLRREADRLLGQGETGS